MDLFEHIGTMRLLGNIYDVDMLPTGVEGDVAPLLFGEAMTSHAMRMPPGIYPAHSHDVELMILCVTGACDVFQGDGSIRGRMQSMSLLHVPKDAEIGVEVTGDKPCDILVFVAPIKMSREEFLAHLNKTDTDTH